MRKGASTCELLFLTFHFRVQLINSALMISGGQQRDSAKYIHVSILPETPLPPRLPHNLKQNSLSYTEGLCWLSILSIALLNCFQSNAARESNREMRDEGGLQTES